MSVLDHHQRLPLSRRRVVKWIVIVQNSVSQNRCSAGWSRGKIQQHGTGPCFYDPQIVRCAGLLWKINTWDETTSLFCSHVSKVQRTNNKANWSLSKRSGIWQLSHDIGRNTKPKRPWAESPPKKDDIPQDWEGWLFHLFSKLSAKRIFLQLEKAYQETAWSLPPGFCSFQSLLESQQTPPRRKQYWLVILSPCKTGWCSRAAWSFRYSEACHFASVSPDRQ